MTTNSACTTKVKNECSYSSSPHIRLHGVDRDNLHIRCRYTVGGIDNWLFRERKRTSEQLGESVRAVLTLFCGGSVEAGWRSDARSTSNLTLPVSQAATSHLRCLRASLSHIMARARESNDGVLSLFLSLMMPTASLSLQSRGGGCLIRPDRA